MNELRKDSESKKELAKKPAPDQDTPTQDPGTVLESATDDPADSCDSECSSCSVDCSSRSGGAREKIETHESATIKHTIAVVSGKGGVGKSLVTSLLALSLKKAGYKVGILDADITGPSIPRAFGVHSRLFATQDGIEPADTDAGIQIVSTNLALPDETTPVLWRGTIISGLVKQFYADVMWGELDFLLIDMPPGTGDVPMTVYQSIPVDGVVVVTAPQALVSMIVGKAINMAGMMDVPVLGLVENMSYFVCSSCSSEHAIFGPSGIDALAAEYSVDLVATLPIAPDFAELMDAGMAGAIKTDLLDDFSAKIVAKVTQ